MNWLTYLLLSWIVAFFGLLNIPHMLGGNFVNLVGFWISAFGAGLIYSLAIKHARDS